MAKKRGAPKGNKNAQKHGFYSSAYTLGEQRELSQTAIDHRQNNIKFFKVIIARTAERIKPSASNPMSFQENIVALHTVVIAISRLHGAINLKQRMITTKETDWGKDIVESLLSFGATQEQIDEELFGVVPARGDGNKRGGQPANLNALKHGFYASQYRLEELRKLEDLNEGDVTEEIALLRVLMKRVFVGLKDDIPLLDYLRAVRVLSSADACLEKLNRTRGLRFGPSVISDAINQALDELFDPNTGLPNCSLFVPQEQIPDSPDLAPPALRRAGEAER